ncbi:MAG: hypothetical protein M0D57_11130 [Sphingobacteriales bacterium JAD_PAG50586_3]|nr:MAG: hypothetical protein M0D57_11130 [Sphingobacteriales bacterium JAD_PAG50586_3]
MEVLFEAKKKLSYNNRLFRAFFIDVMVLVGLMFFFMWIYNSYGKPSYQFYLTLALIGLLIFSNVNKALRKSKNYITKAFVEDGRFKVEYLEKSEEKQMDLDISTIIYYDKKSFAMANLTIQLPDPYTIKQYMIGEWNEDSILDLLEELRKIKSSINHA